ncbi:hypothetical protein HMPREF0880_04247 [Yokenella regensburgei ATCC 43003]|nr:hypothetical protein HMPREF0880_04247 [Yokenella regensburgei ATCC 43003]
MSEEGVHSRSQRGQQPPPRRLAPSPCGYLNICIISFPRHKIVVILKTRCRLRSITRHTGNGRKSCKV